MLKRKIIHFQFSSGSHPSLSPTQVLTHFLRARSGLCLLTAVFTENAQGWRSGEDDRRGDTPKSKARAGGLAVTWSS